IGEFSNGKELIDWLNVSQQHPDICLIDLNMPVMDGYEAILIMKQLWPNLKTLILSMHDPEYAIIRMIKSGANGYVLKEEDPEELKRAIENVHEFGVYHNDRISDRIISQLANGDYKKNDISEKEITFLRHCCSDKTYREIGEEMNLSPRTVEGYRDILFDKLKIRSRTGLVMYAIRTGLFRMENKTSVNPN